MRDGKRAGMSRHGIKLVCIVLFYLIVVIPGKAQTFSQSDREHKRERRIFLREARESDAVYKNSHLNVDAYTFKKGKAGKKLVKKRKGKSLQTAKSSKQKLKMLFRRKKDKRVENEQD